MREIQNVIIKKGKYMNFIVPKNFKRGRLILNQFKIGDLILLIAVVFMSFLSSVLYVSFAGNYIRVWIVVLLLFPSAVAFMLTMPFGINHNLLTFFRILIRFMKKKKNFYWEVIARDEIKKY